MARLDARLELRLDKNTYARLERRAAANHVSVAELVRQAIARSLAEGEGSWQEHVLERGLSLDVPVPSDPTDLVRELDEGYDAEVAPSPGRSAGPALGPPDRA